MIFNLKDQFPLASKSFVAANPQSILERPSQNDVQPILATKRRSVMNKTEAEYALILEAMKRKGEILRWEFEGITLRFANVKYTPDFVVICQQLKYSVLKNDMIQSGITMKFIEVKGPFIKGNRERAVERFRHAKTYWPEFSFEMWQRSKEGWRQIL